MGRALEENDDGEKGVRQGDHSRRRNPVQMAQRHAHGTGALLVPSPRARRVATAGVLSSWRCRTFQLCGPERWRFAFVSSCASRGQAGAGGATRTRSTENTRFFEESVAPGFQAQRFVRNVRLSSGFPRKRACSRRSPAARIVEQAHRAASAGRYRTRMTSDRPNTDLDAVVNQALTIIIEDGPRAAAAFLQQQGAGFALTCRVLAEPSRRRPVCQIGRVDELRHRARAVDLPPASG